MSLQKGFVAPIRGRAATNSRRTRIDVNQTPAYTTDSLVGEIWQQDAQHVRSVKAGRVREQNDFAMCMFDGEILRRRFAKTARLSHKLYTSIRERGGNRICRISRAIRSYNYFKQLAR